MRGFKAVGALVALFALAMVTMGGSGDGSTNPPAKGIQKSSHRVNAASVPSYFCTSATNTIPAGRRYVSIADLSTGPQPVTIAIKSSSNFNPTRWDTIFVPPGGTYAGFFSLGIDSMAIVTTADSILVEVML